MFVSSNTLDAIKSYFTQKLANHFSANEIKQMFEVISAKRLNLNKSDILLAKDVRLSESDLLHYRSIAHRLLENEPFQYIMGETLFYDLNIQVNENVLIPRPETEELVHEVLTFFGPKSPEHILDICTGSGCIALALKKNYPKAHVSATDISEKAIDLAKVNATRLDLDIHFFVNDILHENLPIEESTFDLIVSNPPYITIAEKQQMEANVLDFEPHIALFVPNDDALLFYRLIAEKAMKNLKKGGLLAFELNEHFAIETKSLLEEMGYEHVVIKKDLQGKNRMLFALKN
jgi:release factor glutamine methyltransferase